MVKYTTTFGIKEGYDLEETWKLWEEVHVPRVMEKFRDLLEKYVIIRLENADPSGKPELFGGIEMWFKDMDAARRGIQMMLGQSPDAVDEFSKRVTNLRRVFVLKEKVVYER
jgi:hypothetical protein